MVENTKYIVYGTEICMANYFLFLDELKPNENYKFFCMGGCFIEEDHYRKKVVSRMKQLKIIFLEIVL